MAYHELEPFGPDETWTQAATIAMVIANVNRDPKKRSKPYTVEDFMPAEPQSARERSKALTERISSAMMMLGGRIARPGERRTRKKPPPSRALAILHGGPGATPAAPTRPARSRRKE
jgi:hypothetical protein